MNYFVYIHIFPNGKRYVGLTTQNPERRWGCNGLGYKLYDTNYQLPVYYAINKYGWKNVKHIVYKVETESEMKYLEKYLISYYNTRDRDYGYNICKGGDGVHGFKLTPDMIRRHAEKIRGVPNPHNPQWNANIRSALNNRPHRFIYVYNEDDQLIHKFTGITHAVKGMKIGRHTIMRYISSGDAYKGFIFKKGSPKGA